MKRNSYCNTCELLKYQKSGIQKYIYSCSYVWLDVFQKSLIVCLQYVGEFLQAADSICSDQHFEEIDKVDIKDAVRESVPLCANVDMPGKADAVRTHVSQLQ